MALNPVSYGRFEVQYHGAFLPNKSYAGGTDSVSQDLLELTSPSTITANLSLYSQVLKYLYSNSATSVTFSNDTIVQLS